ncbi:MAG: hypothetical protein Q4D26_11030 [Clostridia bacterium]|nr:hypothetical protein [Clostridia bacterium]
MTADEWKKVESKLSLPHNRVDLKIDEYEISIITTAISKLKYGYLIYVDGKVNMKWAIEETDIRNRFYQKHSKNLLSDKERKKLKLKSTPKYYWYTPWWTSFRSLKAHLIKNNTSIELEEKFL